MLFSGHPHNELITKPYSAAPADHSDARGTKIEIIG